MRPVDRRALVSARAARLPAPALPSLESSDPELREALARLQRRRPPSITSTSRIIRAAGVLDRAHDYLTRSLAVNGPDAASTTRWRGCGVIGASPERALAHAHRAVYLAPRSPVAHNTLGTVLYRLGRRSDARASFTRALELDPKAWYALANLCHLNMAAGDTRAAIGQCHRPRRSRSRRHGQSEATMIAAAPFETTSIVPFPRAPHTLAEAGLPFDLVVQLILKTLHFPAS